MEFFDKLGKKASNAYKMTADKTGKIAKETKLKLKINELKTKVNDIYEDIGKKVYEKHIREEDISIEKDIEEYCTKIDVLSDEIDNLLKQCLELKDKKQCPNCYKEIAIEDNFCSNCGAKQTQEQPREAQILEDLENSEIDEDNKMEEKIVKENLQNDLENNNKQEYNKENKYNKEKKDNKDNKDNKEDKENKENKENKDNKDNKENNGNKENSQKDEEKNSDNEKNNDSNATSNLEKTVAIESDVEMQEGENYDYYEDNEQSIDNNYEDNEQNVDNNYKYNEQDEDEDEDE